MKKSFFIIFTLILGFVIGFNLENKVNKKKYIEIMDWRGVVDGLDILRIQNDTCFVEHIKNKKISHMKFSFKNSYNKKNGILVIKKISGRGNISIYQYPSSFNNNVLSILLDDIDFSGEAPYHFKLLFLNKKKITPKKILFKWCGIVDKEEEITVNFLKKSVKYKHISGSRRIKSDKYFFSNEAFNKNLILKKISGRGEIFRKNILKNSVVIKVYDPFPGSDFYELIIYRGEKNE